jgi:septation ring formation regulator EzrA
VADEEVADLEDRLHEAEADLQRALGELEHVRAHATKCSVALQQIRELARGVEASGAALAGPSPESVVADVGHALRVESMRNR